ncbi:uncharacterized protein LOC122094216 isoform X2 [Macadamia integrifolia]|uniref:uncharacterized protein LOC122094216 isoform X2 n=1 Tax=Macadamia integrifolia TaxID=60698 RepID=UPI001C4EC944|nr:uncharacterized protein LOC122094216 isoform X2 [Macadamia integrifolia]
MEEHRSAEFNKDDDEEFYEKIEAPKYVDFTVPDPPLPDDRSWFCLRVGCDQKHEEDMDPDALYRSFVLRVMAARSPNIKLQKAMSRIAPHANIKCPQSAPAKSSKNRISRITAITLASQKMADKPIKSHPISRLNSASNAKAKQSSVAAKALTTPRPKRCLPGPDPLRSVQNPKTSVSLTKNRVVSKALIFHTPKKNERVKTSLHSHNPVTELCEQVKKLEINKQKQGRSRVVSSRYNNSNNVPTSNTSKAHLRPRKLRIQAEVSFISQGSKDGKVAKSSRCLKSKTKSNLPICNQSLSHERIDDDNSDMEIDGKSRDGSLEASSGSGSSGNDEKTGHDKPLMIVKALENLGATSTQDEKTPIGENPLASSSNVADLISTSEDGGSNYEEKKDLEVGFPKHQTPNVAGVENYTTGSDDKENALLSDDNREININNSHSKMKTLSKHEAHERSQKVIRELSKRDCSTAAATAQKYKKTKPTNPKPFRLRTDERGILKEANLDRRLHLLAPSKENPAVQRLSTGRLQRRHLTETQKTEKSHEGNQTESGKRVKKLKNVYLKTPKCATETKVVSTIQKSQKTLKLMTPQWDDGKERAGKKAECSLKKAKSPFPRPQLVKPQRMASASKATVPLASTSQLSTKKETSSAISRPRDVVEPTDNGNTNTISKVKAIRSCSRGKRPATIPKEPNFQSIHVPKSCTKKLSQAIMS